MPKKMSPKKNVTAILEHWFNSSFFSYKQIFSMLVPLIFDQFFVSIIGLLTTAMISSSSQESVSAVSLVSPLCTMIYSIYSAISSAGTVLIAQYKGQGNQEKMKKAAEQIVIFTFLTAVVFSAFLIIMAEPVIQGMFADAKQEVRDKAVMYLTGNAVSFIFLSVYMGGIAVFRGIGRMKVCLQLSVMINVTHLIASFVFINVMQLDIMGTILSLNLARCIGSIAVVYYLYGKGSKLRICGRDTFHLNKKILKSIVNISAPFALEQICFNGGGILVSMFLVKLGTASVAANAVTNSAISVFYAAGIAVSNLVVTIVGQCIGAGDKKMARDYGRKMLWLGEAVIIISFGLFLPFLDFILKLYQAPQDTMAIIYRLFVITCIPMVFLWVTSNVLPSVLNAAGDVRFTSFVSLLTMWVVRVGLGYFLTMKTNLGVEGIWISVGIEWLIRSIIFYHRFKTERWLKSIEKI